MSIVDYFQEPKAERVLLVEIERNVSPAKRYYLADGYYVTETTDTPSSVIYSPVIGGSGLPEFRRTLNDPFTGNASSSFGNLQLSDKLVSYIQGSTKSEELINAPKGAKFYAYLAAPRSLYPRSDAVALAVGLVSSFSGSTDGSFSLEVTDSKEFIDSKQLQVQTSPLCFGQVRNITPVVSDASTRTYKVHDSAIQAIDAVYDDGVLLSTSQYSVNLTNATFSLNNNPAGKVTADVKGAKVAGTWLTSTTQIIQEILSRCGVSYTTNFDLYSGTIGYYVTESKNLKNVLDELCSAQASYWYLDRLGSLNFKKFPTPSGLGSYFTERELLGEANWQSEERLYNKINFTYKNNWTVLQPRLGASAAQAAFVQKEAEQSFVSNTPNPELVYTESSTIKTYFDSVSDAQQVANTLLSIYSFQRLKFSFVVPFLEPILDLGDTCTVSYDGNEYTGVVTSASDVFDGSYPTQRITMLV